jgi:hypothetical protein
MTEKKKPPKGGSKGGTRFPRVKLDKAQEYTKKLVSKTHTGPQPASVILPGVFDSAGPTGGVRASALKQYGLLEGSVKDYKATEIACELNNSTPEEIKEKLSKVFLTPPLFKTLFDTFLSDNVTKARIKSQAGNLKVHPDSLDECVDVFISSAITAGLAVENGDTITFSASPKAYQADELDSLVRETPVDDVAPDLPSQPDRNMGRQMEKSNHLKANIDIKIDQSMDPEKLDKQLSLLKKYGLI